MPNHWFLFACTPEPHEPSNERLSLEIMRGYIDTLCWVMKLKLVRESRKRRGVCTLTGRRWWEDVNGH